MRCEGIFGPAGTGKSFKLRERITQDNKYALLTATTGVAAINLGSYVTTVHSALGFHNAHSLKENKARVTNNFIRIAYSYKALVIDEVSMISAEMLDDIFECYQDACDTLSRLRGSDSNFGLILTGDFLQLPPVSGKFAFHAKCWKYFEPNIERLTTVYRQFDPIFKDAMQFAREGRGISAAMGLAKCGVKYISEPKLGFPGVTLFPVNDSVKKFNRESYELLDGQEFTFRSVKWGRQMGEWGIIPDELTLKIGCSVMSLANFRAGDGEHGERLVYANGSVGTITDVDLSAAEPSFIVEFERTAWEGYVGYIERNYSVKTCPPDVKKLEYEGPNPPPPLHDDEDEEDDEEFKKERNKRWAIYLSAIREYVAKAKREGLAYLDPETQKWVLGTIRFIPLQMAYALNFHKAQGLTLDAAQIDPRSIWAANPGMMYVALSRVTGPEGLTIVGNPTQVAKRINTSLEVKAWI